jgi:hypothetical protein
VAKAEHGLEVFRKGRRQGQALFRQPGYPLWFKQAPSILSRLLSAPAYWRVRSDPVHNISQRVLI